MTTYEITGNVTAGGSVQAKVGVGGGGGGGGAVNSVNGKTGDVVLTASDVGALPDTTPIPAAYDDTALKARVGAVEEDVSELNENKINEPTTEGTAGQVLTTDGNGGRSWTTPQGGSGDSWHGLPITVADGTAVKFSYDIDFKGILQILVAETTDVASCQLTFHYSDGTSLNSYAALKVNKSVYKPRMSITVVGLTGKMHTIYNIAGESETYTSSATSWSIAPTGAKNLSVFNTDAYVTSFEITFPTAPVSGTLIMVEGM